MSGAPYPAELAKRVELRDGTRLDVRPIRPEDREIERAFVRGMSDESRYQRFMHAIRDLDERALDGFTRIDYSRDMALIAVVCEAAKETQVAVARYVALDAKECEFAIAVADAWQRRGIGALLMRMLIGIAAARGFVRMRGVILATNRNMIALCEALGFRMEPEPGDATLRVAVRDLQPLPAASEAGA